MNTQEAMDVMRVPTSRRQAIGAVLKKIIASHGGIITAEQLVEVARPKLHPLHKYFTWDDTVAAQRFRVLEAREILRVAVEWIENDAGTRDVVRVAVHLSSDRAGGYRLLASVLSDAEMRAQLLSDAERDVDAFRSRYRTLSELRPAIERLGRDVKRAAKRAARAGKR
jgi:hypothetical protein